MKFVRALGDRLTHLGCVARVMLGRQCVLVDVAKQRLQVLGRGKQLQSYRVSTAKRGTGELSESGKTPRGWFWVCDKIGHNEDPNTVFRGRKPIGHFSAYQDVSDPILGRILWLSGLQHANRETRQRYIYIHGSAQTEGFGTTPQSEGCVRMDRRDVVTLYNQVALGCWVYVYDAENALWGQHVASRLLSYWFREV